MKKTFRILGIIAVIGFSILSCDNGNGTTGTTDTTAQDNIDIGNAKTAIQGATFTTTYTQAQGKTQADIKADIQTVLDGLTLHGTMVTITNENFTAPTAGTAGSPAGTNGSYTCMIEITKGAGAKQSVPVTVTITATVYVGPPYTVTFVSNGGSSVSSITGLNSGATITEPAPPTTTAGGATLNRFRGWYKDDGDFAQAWDFGTDTVSSSITLYADWGYRIGDAGPGGGTVYYRDEDGFTVQGYGESSDQGYFAGYTAYYLEAAPADASISVPWGISELPDVTTFANESAPGASEIGNGRKDTQTLIASYSFDTAASVCAAYTGPNGLNDWFLPSFYELRLYRLSSVNGLNGTYGWWTSSQQSLNYAWTFYGNHIYERYDGKGDRLRARAVRAF